MSETKNCPFCYEPIRYNAIKCRYCGSMLTDTPALSGSLSGIELVRYALGDRYEVIDEIGSGGMATVYKAIQRSLGRTVALKVIHQNLVHDQEFVRRLHREAQISASLQHPNIVTIFDVGEAMGVHYMAMEYLEGTDLLRMITITGQMGERQSLKYILSVSRALEYVHKRGLIHRDIKSSNIFICNNAEAAATFSRTDHELGKDEFNKGVPASNLIGSDNYSASRVVLMDFGIAHAASGTRLTRAGAVIGSPEYMSPEQAEAKQIDHRTDIYSLGVVLYECLTGRVPFKTDSFITTIHKVIHEQPDEKKLHHVGENLRRFILNLTSKNSDVRPESASKMIEIIHHLIGEKQEDFIGQYNMTKNKHDDGRKVTMLDARTFILKGQNDEDRIIEKCFDNFHAPLNDPFLDHMVLVIGGTFTMGCTSDHVGDCYDDERPAHQVTLADYYIGKFPVTQRQWRLVMGDDPSHFKDRDDCPVENVSWNDVQEFLMNLNHQTGKQYRLPTEAEWEYAARGGSESCGYTFSGSNTISDVAWHIGNSKNRTQIVGKLNQNELGIHDMSGNVWEWCYDWYGAYNGQSVTNPKGPSSGYYRVLRGGGWHSLPRDCRITRRIDFGLNVYSRDTGFRLALSS